MSTEENKALVRRLYEDGWTGGDLDVAANSYAPDFVNHNPALPGMPPGPDGIKMLIGAFRGVFPDLRYEIEQQVAEGDKVVSHWTMYGTQLGEFMGLPASGKQVAVQGITIDPVAGGRIVEHWSIHDALSLFHQLGRLG